jgi:hypothetical protein
MKDAVGLIVEDGWTVYNTSKEHKVYPPPTLKERPVISPPYKDTPVLKTRKLCLI